jgi:hypothetical protein
MCDGEQNSFYNSEMSTSILCLQPDANDCEVYVSTDQTCFDIIGKVCLNWKTILIAILISDIVQVVFEASLAYSFELTYKPTALDKMLDPDTFDDEMDS